jgi:DNA polymerase/3'-5' exonuclease PolX
MSERLDRNGTLLGPFRLADIPIEGRKRQSRIRKLYYEPVWKITEMQVKLYVKALFPDPPGQLTIQRAKQHPVNSSDKETDLSDEEMELIGGESRSKALEKDIEITATTESPASASQAVLRNKSPVQLSPREETHSASSKQLGSNSRTAVGLVFSCLKL